MPLRTFPRHTFFPNVELEGIEPSSEQENRNAFYMLSHCLLSAQPRSATNLMLHVCAVMVYATITHLMALVPCIDAPMLIPQNKNQRDISPLIYRLSSHEEFAFTVFFFLFFSSWWKINSKCAQAHKGIRWQNIAIYALCKFDMRGNTYNTSHAYIGFNLPVNSSQPQCADTP